MASKDRFNKLLDGKQVRLFELRNARGTRLCVTNYGARIVSLLVPDRSNRPVDVVMGFDSIDDYLGATEVYHGATIGRYANRIAEGRFTLDDQTYELDRNNPPNHLHGGPEGFHTRVWEVREADESSITLAYESGDGEEGYPGKLSLKVQFLLSAQDEVFINYEAATDRPTVLNLTNHAYFNLNGQGSGTILNHTLEINADQYTPVNETLIPTGQAEPVAGTPFDFRQPQPIGSRINDAHIQLQYGNGYDHNYVLNNQGSLEVIARATGDKSGLSMEVLTDQPGVQFYTGNFMSGENLVKGQVPDHFRSAFCLETQHFPDSPNQPSFPSTVLRPGDIFRSTTVYRFMG